MSYLLEHESSGFARVESEGIPVGIPVVLKCLPRLYVLFFFPFYLQFFSSFVVCSFLKLEIVVLLQA